MRGSLTWLVSLLFAHSRVNGSWGLGTFEYSGNLFFFFSGGIDVFLGYEFLLEESHQAVNMEKGVRGWCNGKVIDAFLVGLQRTMMKERRCKSQSYLCGGEWYED